MKKWICILLSLCMLPIQSFTVLAETATQEKQTTGLERWETRIVAEHTVIDHDVVIGGIVSLGQNSALEITGKARLTILEGAQISGDVLVSGDSAKLDNKGIITGDVHITGTHAGLYNAGRIAGCVTMDGSAFKEGQSSMNLTQAVTGYIAHLKMNAWGYSNTTGSFGVLELEEGNHFELWLNGSEIDRVYVRGSGELWMWKNCHVGTLYNYQDQRNGTVVTQLCSGSVCDTMYLYSGHTCVHNGGYAKNVYLMGDAALNLDQGFSGSGNTDISRVENVYQLGKDTEFFANGEIGTLVIEENTYSGGNMAADTVIVRQGLFTIEPSSVGKDQVSLRDRMDDAHVKTLIVEGGRVGIPHKNAKIGKAVLMSRNNTISGNIEQLFTAGHIRPDRFWSEEEGEIDLPLTIGALTSFEKSSTLENNGQVTVFRMVEDRMDLRGTQPETVMTPEKVNQASPISSSSAEKPLELKAGVYQKKNMQSAYFSMDVAALTALEIGLRTPGFMGAALVTLPDGSMCVISGLDEGESKSFFFEDGGTVAVRLIGGAGYYDLNVDRQPPVSLTAQVTKTAIAENGATEKIALDLRALTLKVVHEATGAVLEDTVYDNGVLYFPPQAAQPGETLLVSAIDEDGTCERVETKVSLDKNRAGKLTLMLKEKGGAHVSASDMTDVHAYLYDTDGNFVQEVFSSSGVFTMEHMNSGNYNLMLVRGGVGQWQFPSIGDPKTFGLEDGRDYKLVPLNIQAGKVQKSEAIDVPPKPSVNNGDFASTLSYGTNMPMSVPGSLVLYTLSYEALTQMEGLTAQITINGGAQLVEDSMSVDGRSVAYTNENGVISVPLNAAQGRLQFYMKGTQKGLSASLAALHYVRDGEEHIQYAGSAATQFAQLTMDGPSLISSETAVLSGRGLPLCAISIMDNGSVVGVGSSDFDGNWSVKAKLDTYGEHQLLCRMETAEGAVLESAPMTVLRAPDAPEMVSFTFYYKEHERTNKIQIPADKIGDTDLRYAYQPGEPFSFAVRMENSSAIKTLEIVAEGVGGERTIPATYDAASGEWLASGILDKDENYMPSSFRVRFTLKQDPMAAKQEELLPTLSLQNLTVFNDLGAAEGLPAVGRCYPASAVLHTVDGMFGVGWRSDLETKAAIYEIEGVQYIAVTDARVIRMFVKENSGYVEMLGDAAATVNNGAVTIREQSGAQTTFNKEGRLASQRFADGTSRTYSYDEEGLLTKIKSGTGSTLEFHWQDGHVTRIVCGENEVSYTYDGDHLMLVNGPNGSCCYGYEGDMVLPGRHSMSSFNQNGVRLRVRYDSNGRVIALTDSAGMTTFEYKDLFTVRITDPYGEWMQITYDPQSGKPVRAAGDGIEMEIAYDENLRPVKVTHNNYATAYTYDAGGRLTSAVSELENSVYEYDKYGLVSSVTSGSGTIRYKRDAKGNLTAVEHPDGTKETYTYDKNGRITVKTDRDGTRHQYTYDSDGRITKAVHGKQTISYSYHEDEENGGFSVHVRDGETSMNYALDERGRYTFVAFENGRMFSVNYDGENLANLNEGARVQQEVREAYERELKAARDALEAAVKDSENPEIPALEQALRDLEENPPKDEWHMLASYEYDDLNRLSEIFDERGKSIVRYSYDAHNRIAQVDYEGGTVTQYGYDGGYVSSIITRNAQGTVIHMESYEHDSCGRIMRATVNGETTQYAYDALGRLTGERSADGEIAYSYDMAGNRTSITKNGQTEQYTYNELNQLISGGGAVYAYDRAGRRVSEEHAEGTTQYAYDAQGRLASVLTGQGETKYRYDLLGNLYEIEENGKTRQLLQFPNGMGFAGLEIHADGRERRLIWGAQGLTAMQDESGTAYFHQDVRHCVSAITDAQGSVLARYSYDALGHVVSREESVQNSFTYAGGGGIVETGGLFAMRARFGDVDTGTFLTPDPAGQYYDLNLYRYAYGDPVNYIDLTGKDGLSIGTTTTGFNNGNNPFNQGNSGQTQNIYVPPSDDNNDNNNSGGGSGDSSLYEYWMEGSSDGHIDVTASVAPEPEINVPLVLGGAALAVGAVVTAPVWVPAVVTALTTLVGSLSASQLATAAVTTTVLAGMALTPDIVVQPAHSATVSDPPYITPTILNNPTMDPSGYVYEAVESNRLEGVTATAYYQQDGQAVFWNAQDYDQHNPQTTTARGVYAWFVPEGTWQVTYHKEGYENAQSDWLPVPPPQTQINQGMVSLAAPEMTHAVLYDDSVEVTFSRYMDVKSVNMQTMTVSGAQALAVEPLNPEQEAGGYDVLASRFAVLLSGDAQRVQVSVTQQAKSYAGVAADAQTLTAVRASRVSEIRAQNAIELTVGVHSSATLVLDTDGGYVNLHVTAEADMEDFLCVDSVSAIDGSGRVQLSLTGLRPGWTALVINELTTGTQVVIPVTVLAAQ